MTVVAKKPYTGASRSHDPADGSQACYSRETVSVVIPALNEARNLPHVLPYIPEGVFEIIIVDGGSTDDTIDVVSSVCPRARVVRQPGRGKGDALQCGFREARGSIIVMLDADGSTDPREITMFVEGITHQGADFVKGSRYMDGGGSADISVLRSLGNRGLTAMVNVLFRTKYTDLCYGYSAFRTGCLVGLAPNCEGFEVETLLNIRAAKANLRVGEVPSVEGARIHGSSHLRTFRDGFRVLRTILSERVHAGVPR